MILHVPLHKKTLAVDKIAQSERKRVLLPILHNRQQIDDCHLHVHLRMETLGLAGDEIELMGLNERERELALLLKILRNRHFVPHGLPLMVRDFHHRKEREQELVSVPEGDKQEVVNRPSPAAGRERK
jgi:hypothetical protein